MQNDETPLETPLAAPPAQRPNRKRTWIGMGAVLAALLMLALIPDPGAVDPDAPPPAADGTSGAAPDAVDATVVGKPAPLHYTLKDLNGVDVKLESFKGKVILINFWATWCGPCRVEMPQLVDLAARYGDRITVVGISVDDTPDQIREFAAEFKVTYPMLVGRGHDDALISLGYDGSVPMTVFLDAEGHVRNRFIGIRTTETWARHIDALF